MDTIPETANRFTFDAIKCKVRVVKVYDGDSFDVIFPFKNEFYQVHCRAYGYNCAELRSHDENEKIAGYKARDFLREKILGKIFDAEFGPFDKYGRPLIRLTIENQKLDQLMITAGHGKEYYGQGEKKF